MIIKWVFLKAVAFFIFFSLEKSQKSNKCLHVAPTFFHINSLHGCCIGLHDCEQMFQFQSDVCLPWFSNLLFFTDSYFYLIMHLIILKVGRHRQGRREEGGETQQRALAALKSSPQGLGVSLCSSTSFTRSAPRAPQPSKVLNIADCKVAQRWSQRKEVLQLSSSCASVE